MMEWTFYSPTLTLNIPSQAKPLPTPGKWVVAATTEVMFLHCQSPVAVFAWCGIMKSQPPPPTLFLTRTLSAPSHLEPHANANFSARSRCSSQSLHPQKREENLGKINTVGGWVEVGGGDHPHPIRANCFSIYMQTLFSIFDGHHHTHGHHVGCWTVSPGLS